ncbi:MAG: pseudaminic acid biosynthesis-associated methylase [Pseudomonadota bacterium]
MSNYKTEQEEFWAGSFGDDYIARNNSASLLMSKVALWSRMLRSANKIDSVFELGCNIGLNLVALRRLNPKIEVGGVEINEAAAAQARENTKGHIVRGSIVDELTCDTADLTFTAGVLIHINPEALPNVYANLYNKSRRYVLVAEYYNPSPVAIPYRGHDDRLFKRDFAGELMDEFKMKLVDYGFTYKRDNWAPQDDITWFLLEK